MGVDRELIRFPDEDAPKNTEMETETDDMDPEEPLKEDHENTENENTEMEAHQEMEGHRRTSVEVEVEAEVEVENTQENHEFKYELDDKIECDYRGKGKWYPATVSTKNIEDGTYDVDYDDGEFEKGVVEERLRVKKPKESAPSKVQAPVAR